MPTTQTALFDMPSGSASARPKRPRPSYTTPRWPWQPLDRFFPAPAPGAQVPAERHGLNRKRIARMRDRALLNDWEADEVAAAVGVHPALLWPEWFDAVLQDAAAMEAEAEAEARDRAVQLPVLNLVGVA